MSYITNQAYLSVGSEITQGKKILAEAINAIGGSASATESFQELAQDIQDTPTSGVLSNGIVQSEPFSFLGYVCKSGAYPFSEIDDDSVTVISRGYAFSNQTRLLKVKMNALATISGDAVFQGCSSLQEINLPNLTTISGGAVFLDCSSLQEVNMPNLTTISGSNVFSGTENLQYAIFPKLTHVSGNTLFYYGFGLISIEFGTLTRLSSPFYASLVANLRNITIGQDTDVNLPFQGWVAINVINEGQSGIDELNTNLYSNLLTKLYDHSQDGETRTLRIGWLAKVTADNIAYANNKGWTLTT